MFTTDSTRVRTVTDIASRTTEKKGLTLRSFLYVQPSMTPEDCVAIDVDALVVDLSRVTSQQMLLESMPWLRSLSTHSALRGRPMLLRLPSAASLRAWDRSLDTLLSPNLFGVILSGCRTGADLQDFGRTVASSERRVGLAEGAVRFVCLVDTPGAIENLGRMRKASPRLWGVALGNADYMARQGGRRPADLALVSEEQLVGEATNHGLQVIGSPLTEISDLRSLAETCNRIVQGGIHGMFVLTPSQVSVVNRAFTPGASELSGQNPVVREVGGQATRPKAATENVHVIRSRDLPAELARGQRGVVGQATAVIAKGISFRRGAVYESSRETTLDSGLLAQWRGAFVQHEPLTESGPAAKRMGLQDVLVPQPLLVALALASCEELMSEPPRAHLGIQEVIYERPVHVGDTVRSQMRIEDVKLTKRGDHRVVRTKHILVNQDGERVLTLVKLSALSPGSVEDESSMSSPDDAMFAQAPASVLTNKILTGEPSPSMRYVALEAGQVVLHRGCTSQSSVESRMTRRMLGSNPSSDPMGLATSLAEMGRWMEARIELGPVWSENIEYSSAVTTFDDGQQLGMMSRVIDVKPLGEHHEMVRIKTLGLRGLDAAEKLEGFLLPDELFGAQPLRPSDYERICQNRVPLLVGRIVTQSVRRIIRTRTSG